MSDKLPAPVPAVAPGTGAIPPVDSQAAPAATAAASDAAATAGDVPLDANGQPLTKSALKRLQKEKDLAAKKALKSSNKPQPAAGGAAAAPKKEKVVKKKEEAPEEPAYVEVPEGHKKGQSQPLFPAQPLRPQAAERRAPCAQASTDLSETRGQTFQTRWRPDTTLTTSKRRGTHGGGRATTLSRHSRLRLRPSIRTLTRNPSSCPAAARSRARSTGARSTPKRRSSSRRRPPTSRAACTSDTRLLSVFRTLSSAGAFTRSRPKRL